MIGQFSSQELGKKPFSEDVLYDSDITLTIGIPVYNGEKTLFSTLASIFNQLDDLNGALKLEVLISDNASTDKTFEIVNFYREKFPTILKYVKNDHNVGATQNIRKIIENASSEYIWFLGDDNLYEKALLYFARVLYYTPERPKAIVVKSDVWDYTMSSIIYPRHIKDNILTKDCKKFLRRARESVFFLGSLILKVDLARKYLSEVDFDDFYPQTETLFYVLTKETGLFLLINRPLVKERGGSWDYEFTLMKKLDVFLSMRKTSTKFFDKSFATNHISKASIAFFLRKNYRSLSKLNDKNILIKLNKAGFLSGLWGRIILGFNLISPKKTLIALGLLLKIGSVRSKIF